MSLCNDKGPTYQENITILNKYAPNIRTPTYTKYSNKILTNLKWEIDNNTIIIGDFSTPLPTDYTYRKLIRKHWTLHFRSNKPNRYIQNISSNNSRMFILLKHTRTILQNISYVRPQNKI